MGTLRFHYTNPKFDGLPWPAASGKKKKPRTCVKKPLAQSEAQAEVADLRREYPGARWSSCFCAVCDGWHVERN